MKPSSAKGLRKVQVGDRGAYVWTWNGMWFISLTTNLTQDAMVGSEADAVEMATRWLSSPACPMWVGRVAS